MNAFMSLKLVALLCLIVGVVSVAVTRYYFPQIQTKIVETTKEVVRTDIQTVVKTVTLPNGNTESTTTITDHTIKTDIQNKELTIVKAKDWLVSGSVDSNFKLDTPMYGLQVQRRILGPVFVGGLLDTKGNVGLSVGMEF